MPAGYPGPDDLWVGESPSLSSSSSSSSTSSVADCLHSEGKGSPPSGLDNAVERASGVAKEIAASAKARTLVGGLSEGRGTASQEPQTVQGDFVLLALFDGIRGCSVALRELGVEPLVDYSSEVDANCRKLIAKKFPKAVQLGDLKKIGESSLARMLVTHGKQRPWLVVGGSPCQDLAGGGGARPKCMGLVGKRSKLFFEYVRVVSTLIRLGAQVAFLLENVASMSDENRDVMTAALGIDPVKIDSVLVSACHRRRYYWTNLTVAPVEPQKVSLDACLEEATTSPAKKVLP